MGEHALHTYCLILAGGNGKRLWPYSRTQMPKQFLDFFGIGKSLLRMTYERFAKFIPAERIIVCTFTEHVHLVREQLPEVLPHNILAEPVQLNTAPVAAWATLHALHQDPDACLVVSPSDQYILNEDEFATQIIRGLDFVKQEHKAIVLGVQPTMPNTNYGYIQKGASIGNEGFNLVQTFTEKPTEDFARLFVESGEFLWNTGLSMWNAADMAQHLPYFLPDTESTMLRPERLLKMSMEEMTKDIQMHYVHNGNNALDLVLLEKLTGYVVVQECRYGWVDLGSWRDIASVSTTDVDGNTANATSHLMMRGCKDNIIHIPKEKLTILQGLEGYLVAEHNNVLIIVKKDDTETLRNMMNEAHLRFGEAYK